MAFLIDTDICSAHLRGSAKVTSRFLQHTGQLHLSAVTVGELLSWTLRKKSSPKFQHGLTALLSDVSVLDLTIDVARKLGELRAELFDRGQPVASVDVMIAATAVVHGLTVVTHNIQHFSRIPGVTIDDWLGP